MALEPVNYRTHSREIEETYLKVIRSEDPGLKWLILSPNANKEYYVSATGQELSDFLDTFKSDDSVEFGLCKTSPPGSDVEKICLVGWCPDSAPLKSRSSFASNFNEISANVLKSYHVQVTARDEDDLDEQEILMRLSNAAGARYSIQDTKVSKVAKPVVRHASPKPFARETSKPVVRESPKPVVRESPKPVVRETSKPVVRESPKPVARESPKPVARESPEDEWDEPEVTERNLQETPLKPNTSSWKPIGKIDLQKIIAEEKAKEDPRLITKSTSQSAKINPANDIAQLKEKSKLKRDQEFESFRNKSESVKPVEVQQEHEEDKEEDKEEDEEQEVNALKAKFEQLGAVSANEPVIIQPKKYTPSNSFRTSPSPSPSLISKDNYKKVGVPLPGMHIEDDSDDNANDNDNDGWSDEEEPAPALPTRSQPAPPKRDEPEEEEGEEEKEEPAPALPSRSQPAPPKREEPKEEPAPALPSRRKSPSPAEPEKEEHTEDEEDKEEEEEEEEHHVHEEPAPALPHRSQPAEPQLPPRRAAQPPPPPPKKVSKPQAVAEYDYDADEDNELTFKEGDKIVNIEFVDDDWWLGELDNGSKGLFPSNYVSLV